MMALKLKTKKVRKKEKSSKKFKGTGLKIVDEDDFGNFGFTSSGKRKDESDSDDKEADELPQIAAVVDDRPEEVKALETFSQANKWKQFSSTNAEHSPASDNNSHSKDVSPPRRRRRHDSDASGGSSPNSPLQIFQNSPPPSGRVRHDSSDDDASPPGRQKDDFSKDLSPPQRKGNDSDLSPPRRKGNDSDLSPPRRKRNDSDLSPPRRKRNDSDLSPPRRNSNSSSRDQRSQSRRSGYDSRYSSTSRDSHSRRDDSDISPPRSKRRYDDDSKDRHQSSRLESRRDKDLSPPRRHRRETRVRRAIAAPEILEDDSSNDPNAKTLDGKKAGLQKGTAVKQELEELRKRENAMFATLDDSLTGRNAQTRIGAAKQRQMAEEAARKKEEERVAAERKKQYDKWGKGLKQVEDQAARVESALHEIDKPLARYSDDQDLDIHLRNMDRDGDPMLKFLSKKKRKGVDKPMYNGPAPPPNRFHVPPGYRWDGVDRSNGYEKQWFDRINSKKALQDEAYKWSVEDL